jgi:hypothetical protein
MILALRILILILLRRPHRRVERDMRWIMILRTWSFISGGGRLGQVVMVLLRMGLKEGRDPDRIGLEECLMNTMVYEY